MEIDVGELIIDEIINIPDIELDYIKETPETEEITILPTKEGVSLEGLFHKVTIPEEPNFIEENIKQGISIFGKEGTLIPTAVDGGYDLSKIGTTVTVEAQGAIAKGATWEGVLNKDVTYLCNTQTTNLSATYTRFSKDLSVACYRDVSSTANTYNIAFFNTQTLNYDIYPVDVSHITRANTFSVVSISFDGTLAILQTGNSSKENFIIAIEIDIENKSAVAYECKIEGMAGGNASTWCNGCGLLYNSGRIWKYKYNKEMHSLDLLDDYANNSGIGQSPIQWARIDAQTFIGLSGSTIHKFIIDENGFLHTSKALSGYTNYSYFRISYDGKYISGKNYLYSLNTADLSLTLLSNDIGTGTNATTFPFSGGKLIVGTNLYDITNVSQDNTTATLLYTHESSIVPHNSFGYFDIYNKYLDISNKIVYFPNGEAVQYSIHSLQGNQMENGNYYGIASSLMSIGDKGTAQLLFSM